MNPWLLLLIGGALFAIREQVSAAIDYTPGAVPAGGNTFAPDYSNVFYDADSETYYDGSTGMQVAAPPADWFGDVQTGTESTAELLDAPNVESDNLAAFLEVIKYAEGTDNSRGYDTIFGYQYFDSATAKDHPRRIVSSGNLRSDAAGAYQIMSFTWDSVIQPALRLPDFSPASQDAAAIHLLKIRNAYNDVLAGNFGGAISKLNREWASLPGSPYGQPTRSMNDILAVYTSSGGSVA